MYWTWPNTLTGGNPRRSVRRLAWAAPMYWTWPNTPTGGNPRRHRRPARSGQRAAASAQRRQMLRGGRLSKAPGVLPSCVMKDTELFFVTHWARRRTCYLPAKGLIDR